MVSRTSDQYCLSMLPLIIIGRSLLCIIMLKFLAILLD